MILIDFDAFDERTNSELWTHFWSDGSAGSCVSDFPPTARANITLQWSEAFAELPTGASLLDVACGRGALLEIAIAAGVQQCGGNLLGVDSARLPEPHPAGSRLLQNMDANDLPFADGSMAMVVSQFGLEYAGLASALAEAARVCGGRLIALVHAGDGIVCRQMREQAEQIGWLLDDQDFVRRLGAAARAREDEAVRLIAAIDRGVAAAENYSLLQHVRDCVVALSDARRRLAPAVDRRAKRTPLAG